MKKDKYHFSDQKFDQFLVRWLNKGLEPHEQKEWNQILLFHSQFREQLADWIRALRDPGWSMNQKKRS